MLFLFNKFKQPVCLVSGCHNSQFDVGLHNLLKNPWDAYAHGTWVPECWSWYLTSKPNGGSIATIGTTGLCWFGAEYNGGGTDWLNVEFFAGYSLGYRNIGDLWYLSLIHYLYNFPINWDSPAGSDSCIDAKTLQQWTLFGDPSLKIGGYSS